MENEYRISTGYKIFYGSMAAGAVGLGLFIEIKSASDSTVKAQIIGLTFCLVPAIFLVLYVLRRKVVINDQSITVIGIFGSRRFMNDNVRGFRVEDKAIFIYPIAEGVKRIMINDHNAIGNSFGLIQIFAETYPDLNALESQAVLLEILTNKELGYTENERNEKLEKAKTKALIFNIVGGILFLSCFIKGYDFIVCLITFPYPLTGVYLIITSKGLIRFFTKNNSPLPSLYIGMYVPTIVLMIITIVNYHIIDRDCIWLPFILITSFLIFILAIKGTSKINGKGQYVMLVIIAFFYGYGSTLFINCGFDSSTPKTFDASVVEKHKAGDISYIEISDWGNYKESGEIKVLNGFYEQVETGSVVKVKQKKGLFNIPWYYVNQ